MPELEFVLDKAASKAGGDKYVCSTDQSFTIYVPQTISRVSSKVPVQKLMITISSASSSPVANKSS